MDYFEKDKLEYFKLICIQMHTRKILCIKNKIKKIIILNIECHMCDSKISSNRRSKKLNIKYVEADRS